MFNFLIINTLRFRHVACSAGLPVCPVRRVGFRPSRARPDLTADVRTRGLHRTGVCRGLRAPPVTLTACGETPRPRTARKRRTACAEGSGRGLGGQSVGVPACGRPVGRRKGACARVRVCAWVGACMCACAHVRMSRAYKCGTSAFRSGRAYTPACAGTGAHVPGPVASALRRRHRGASPPHRPQARPGLCGGLRMHAPYRMRPFP